MSAFRGRTHDNDWIEVTLSPFFVPALLRKRVESFKDSRKGARKFEPQTRFLILCSGIAVSWGAVIFAGNLALQ